MFPFLNISSFMRMHITPWMPPNWFVEAIRTLQFGDGATWAWTALKLAVLGVTLAVLAAWLFDRRLRKGVRL